MPLETIDETHSVRLEASDILDTSIRPLIPTSHPLQDTKTPERNEAFFSLSPEIVSTFSNFSEIFTMQPHISNICSIIIAILQELKKLHDLDLISANLHPEHITLSMTDTGFFQADIRHALYINVNTTPVLSHNIPHEYRPPEHGNPDIGPILPQYDIFSLALLIIATLCPARFAHQKTTIHDCLSNPSMVPPTDENHLLQSLLMSDWFNLAPMHKMRTTLMQRYQIPLPCFVLFMKTLQAMLVNDPTERMTTAEALNAFQHIIQQYEVLTQHSDYFQQDNIPPVLQSRILTTEQKAPFTEYLTVLDDSIKNCTQYMQTRNAWADLPAHKKYKQLATTQAGYRSLFEFRRTYHKGQTTHKEIINTFFERIETVDEACIILIPLALGAELVNLSWHQWDIWNIVHQNDELWQCVYQNEPHDAHDPNAHYFSVSWESIIGHIEPRIAALKKCIHVLRQVAPTPDYFDTLNHILLTLLLTCNQKLTQEEQELFKHIQWLHTHISIAQEETQPLRSISLNEITRQTQQTINTQERCIRALRAHKLLKTPITELSIQYDQSTKQYHKKLTTHRNWLEKHIGLLKQDVVFLEQYKQPDYTQQNDFAVLLHEALPTLYSQHTTINAQEKELFIYVVDRAHTLSNPLETSSSSPPSGSGGRETDTSFFTTHSTDGLTNPPPILGTDNTP